MREDDEGRQNKRRWLWLALTAVATILFVLIVPPLVSVSRYKSQVTSLVSCSLGRPVRLSSVSVRLLPRPGFVLDDLTVEEDPAFGAEPVLHASTVTAPIRIFSLWRGKLEISEISVDDASVNLVRSPDGRWNLDPLFETKASKAGNGANGGSSASPVPYLSASNCRVNFKSGIEKLPFSLVSADISLWQPNPGQWRVRLRGQPARTDVSLDMADTGIVELDATARRAPQLEQIPVQLDLEWRDAQLGQLSRLITGSDAGWRGDLRGDVHVDGTADTAKITARLRASGVHRVEFAPLAPMDFDANCSLVYHYSRQAVEGLVCDSPLGDGHLRVTGDVPGNGATPHYSLELDHVPAGAGLDALRTFRSGVDPGLEAVGTISGKINYAENPAANGTDPGAGNKKGPKTRGSVPHAPSLAGPLTGSFTVEGLRLSSGALNRSLAAPKFVLEPQPGDNPALAGSISFPLGAPGLLTLDVRLGLRGYQLTARGEASIQRARELANAVGLKQAAAFASLAGDPLAIDLDARGPWLPPEESLPGGIQPGGLAAGAVSGLISSFGPENSAAPTADTINATITLRNANWKAGFLANQVQISNATLHVGNGQMRWDPIDFSYGPLKGTASLDLPQACDTPEPCPAQLPSLNIQFGDLDVATLESAMLGARVKGTLLSDLIDRLRPSSAPALPEMQVTVSAGSLVLGPVTLEDATARVHTVPTGAEITSLDAAFLGGTVHGSGTMTTGDKPLYALTADFEKLNPVALGQFLGENWHGGRIDASGKIELSGYTGNDLASSANGTLHFEWQHGAVGAGRGPASAVPPALSRFDRWTADALIANGKITLDENQVAAGSRKQAVSATVTIAEPPEVSFSTAKQMRASRH